MMEGMKRLGWSMDGSLALHRPSGPALHLLQTNIEGLLGEMKSAWTQSVVDRLSGRAAEDQAGAPKSSCELSTQSLKRGVRKFMEGVEEIDVQESVRLVGRLPLRDKKLLGAVLAGSVQTMKEKVW